MYFSTGKNWFGKKNSPNTLQTMQLPSCPLSWHQATSIASDRKPEMETIIMKRTEEKLIEMGWFFSLLSVFVGLLVTSSRVGLSFGEFIPILKTKVTFRQRCCRFFYNTKKQQNCETKQHLVNVGNGQLRNHPPCSLATGGWLDGASNTMGVDEPASLCQGFVICFPR